MAPCPAIDSDRVERERGEHGQPAAGVYLTSGMRAGLTSDIGGSTYPYCPSIPPITPIDVPFIVEMGNVFPSALATLSLVKCYHKEETLTPPSLNMRAGA